MTLGSVGAAGLAAEGAAAVVEAAFLAEGAGEHLPWDSARSSSVLRPASDWERPEPIRYHLPTDEGFRAHRFAGSAQQVLAAMPFAAYHFSSSVLQSTNLMSHTLPAAEVARIADDVVRALADGGRTAIVSTTFLDASSTDDLDAAIKQRLSGTRTVEIDGGELSDSPQHRIGELFQALRLAYPKVEFKPSGHGDYSDLLSFLGALKQSGVVSRRLPLTIVANGYAPKTEAGDDLFGLLRDIAHDQRNFPYVRILITTPFLASGHHGQHAWFGASETHFRPQGRQVAERVDEVAEAK